MDIEQNFDNLCVQYSLRLAYSSKRLKSILRQVMTICLLIRVDTYLALLDYFTDSDSGSHLSE